MKSIILIFISTLITTVAFSQDSLRSVIAKETIVKLNSETIKSQRFTPTLSEIDSVDKYLAKFFSTENDNYSSYFRQYIGLLINDGKVIYVLASCDKKSMIPDGKLLLPPLHGDKCYFSAKFFLNSKHIDKVDFY